MKKDKILFENPEIDLKRCIFLGQGRYGQVYLMSDGRVVKIFKDQESCVKEYIILESVKGNKHFPKAYECRDNYLIRDYVDGTCLDKYISKYGLSENLARNIVELIEDFKKLGFKRLDMRCSHIFIQDDESVMVIDPREHFTKTVSYPKKLLSKLRKLKISRKLSNNLSTLNNSLYSGHKNKTA